MSNRIDQLVGALVEITKIKEENRCLKEENTYLKSLSQTFVQNNPNNKNNVTVKK